MKRIFSILGLAIILLGAASLAANEAAYVAAMGLLAASVVTGR